MQWFVAAFTLDPGESIADVVDGRATRYSAVAAESIRSPKGLLEVDRETAIADFYHDCGWHEAEAAASQLTSDSPSTRTARVSTPSWQRLPSDYVVCTDERAITVEGQRLLENRLVPSVDIDSGHSPMLCKADVLTDIIERVATKANRGA